MLLGTIYSCLDWKYAKLIDLLLGPEKKSCCRKILSFRSLSMNLSIAPSSRNTFCFSSIALKWLCKMFWKKDKRRFQCFQVSCFFWFTTTFLISIEQGVTFSDQSDSWHIYFHWQTMTVSQSSNRRWPAIQCNNLRKARSRTQNFLCL